MDRRRQEEEEVEILVSGITRLASKTRTEAWA